MPFNNNPSPATLASLQNVKTIPYWLDDPSRPQPAVPLNETIRAELCIIGGGFTGLWTALLAKEQDPNRDVVLIEGDFVASGASGRNGGFVSASLTHGFSNGFSRWPGEMQTLVRLGHDNLDGIEAAIRKYKIDCDFIRSGELVAATEAYQIEEMLEEAELGSQHGEQLTFLDTDQTRALVNSPIHLAGLLDEACAMVHPARLAWGLRRACLEAGVRLFEGTKASGLSASSTSVTVQTPGGDIHAQRVALASNAYPPLLKRLVHYIVPVYDYVLMSEPLSPAQRAQIGWHGRQGLGDAGNQFHYSQITADGRILWGGYDAIYYRGNGFGPQYEQNPEAWARLAEHFFETFPALRGLKFTHAWGGAIDTCSRFSAFWGTAFAGRVTYALGYTGLGVGASRVGAQVMLDLLDGRETERTRLQMVRGKPFPFPPEPLRAPIVNFTRWSLAQADQNGGKRNLWLRLLDAAGLGFDT